jgi:hypothetical protein
MDRAANTRKECANMTKLIESVKAWFAGLSPVEYMGLGVGLLVAVTLLLAATYAVLVRVVL